MHVPESEQYDDQKFEKQHLNPAVLNFKKQNATNRERKIEKDEANFIPEPTSKILGINSRKRFVPEALKESLESLEFFKITNESRIKRERIIVNPKPENKQNFEIKQKNPEVPDMLDKFLAEQILSKPSESKIPNLPKGQVLKINIYTT